jgi:hypothetical protein
MKLPDELRAWHWAGRVLNGACECPDSTPDWVTDERVRLVTDAVIAVAYVDNAWPVDVGRVGDVLYTRGVFDEIGGAAFIIELMASWSERIDRARYLGTIYANYLIAMAAVEDELVTNEELAALIDRRTKIRACAGDAFASLIAAKEAA